MKRLILIRHAKSSWSGSNPSDKLRPLNERGKEAALQMGQWLQRADHMPDEVITSSATRCIQTWEGLAKTSGSAVTARPEDDLYLADLPAMLAALQSATGNTVLMLGHMPGIGAFARALRRDPPPLHDQFSKYPTGAATVLEFRIDDWRNAQIGIAKFIAYMSPKELA